MNIEQAREYLAIWGQVIDGLRRQRYINKFGRGQLLCQLMTWGSGNPVAWNLFDVFEIADSHMRLYRTTWRKDSDKRTFESLQDCQEHVRPFQATVEVGWVPFYRPRVEPLLAQLRQIRVPLAVAETWEDSHRDCL